MRVISPKGLEALQKNAANPERQKNAAEALRKKFADPAFKEEVERKSRETRVKNWYVPPKPGRSPY